MRGEGFRVGKGSRTMSLDPRMRTASELPRLWKEDTLRDKKYETVASHLQEQHIGKMACVEAVPSLQRVDHTSSSVSVHHGSMKNT